MRGRGWRRAVLAGLFLCGAAMAGEEATGPFSYVVRAKAPDDPNAGREVGHQWAEATIRAAMIVFALPSVDGDTAGVADRDVRVAPGPWTVAVRFKNPVPLARRDAALRDMREALALGARDNPPGVGAPQLVAAPWPMALQPACPITGRVFSETVPPYYAEVAGFVVYVADADAAAKAVADPEGTFAKLAARKMLAEPVSQVCPQMGNRVNKAVFFDKDGRRVYVCCAGCLAPLQKNWAKTREKIAALAAQGDPADVPGM